ncbi:MAG TPA: hypothetical protein VLX32_05050 [Candidatus Acidoferrum sp.]|nr:hypothetical protein [Candidatus Acidoferrum sp.]
MNGTGDPKERVAIIQMNAELQRAQIELSRIQFAIGKLFTRFATEDIARNAQKETVTAALEVLQTLNGFYSALATHRPGDCAILKPGTRRLSEEDTLHAIRCVSGYLRRQREQYVQMGKPIPAEQRARMERFFPTSLLQRILIVEMAGCRIDNPPFYQEAKELGFANLPEITHMASLTFDDVIVFHESLTERILFHALVHTVQFHLLGVDAYTELFVRSFLRVNSHFLVPLEAHAFALDSKFAANGERAFSVEEEVRQWIEEGRY